MKKITMLLLAALLLIGIASAASAFEYAPAEKLEIGGSALFVSADPIKIS